MAEYLPVYDTTLHRWKLVAIGDIAGNMTAAQIVQVLQSAFSRLTWLMSGNSTDGQPDTATAAAIDAFMAATGVTSDYIAFLDLGAAAASAGTLTIANAYSASSADNVVLVQSHGVLAIANAYSGSFADNITLSNPSLLVLAIDDAYSGSFADAVTLAQSHGVLAIADAYSASFADTVTLAVAGGTLTIADAYSASTADNVVLSAGTAPPLFSENFSTDLSQFGTFTNTGTAGAAVIESSKLKMTFNSNTLFKLAYLPTTATFTPVNGRVVAITFDPTIRWDNDASNGTSAGLRLQGVNDNWVFFGVGGIVDFEEHNDRIVSLTNAAPSSFAARATGFDHEYWTGLKTRMELRFTSATTVDVWLSSDGAAFVRKAQNLTIPDLGASFAPCVSLAGLTSNTVITAYLDDMEVR